MMAMITLPEDTTGCCRTCLNSASPTMYDIFDDREDSYSLARMLTVCTSIQVDAADETMPPKLCRSCYHCLMSFYDFKRLAEDIDRKLRQRFNEEGPEQSVKNELGGGLELLLINNIDIKVKDEDFFGDINIPDNSDNLISEENLAIENQIKNEDIFSDDMPDNSQISKGNGFTSKKPRRKIRLKEKQKSFRCPVCSQTFKYHTSYIKHIERHRQLQTQETNLETVKCEVCCRSFTSLNALSAHQRMHVNKGRILDCRFCGKVFKKISHLKRHELCHEDNRPYKCTECSRSFRTEKNLIDHINFKHKGIRPYSCPSCTKGFANAIALSNHMKLHTRVVPYLCSTCGKRFDSTTNLNQHVQRHLGYKPFQCDECPKKFVTKGELKSHKITHTGVKEFACDQCGSTFTKKSSLNKHCMTHLGLKPFKCESCPMKFTFKEHLKVHTRIHTGEKPYRCEHCERAFTQSGDLLKHKRSHFGDHLYKCDDCGESFRLKTELRHHISKHYVASMRSQGNSEQGVRDNIDCDSYREQ